MATAATASLPAVHETASYRNGLAAGRLAVSTGIVRNVRLGHAPATGAGVQFRAGYWTGIVRAAGLDAPVPATTVVR